VNLRQRFGSWLLRDVSGFYDNGGTTTSPAAWLVNHLAYGGANGTTVAGVKVDEWIAEGMPAVYACVHAISETVGQLPLKLYKKTSTGREIADEHPLYVLLHDLPNPEMTAYQFRELLTRHLAMWGRAYAFVDRDPAGEVRALWPIHPLRVKVDRDSLNRKRYTVKMSDGKPEEFLFDPNRPPILHLHMNSNDGLDGRSPIWINRESLGVTKASDEFVGAYFGNGAVPGVIITHPGKELSPKAIDNFKRQWNEKFGGASNRNKVALMPEDVKVNVVGVDPQKSQLTELRQEQISSAARIWRVPSFIIENHGKDTSWGSGIAERMIGWINTGLMPYFEQWQQAIARDCLSRKTYRTHYAKFVTAALERGDLKQTMDAIAVGRQNTILSGDEGRELLDMNQIPDGVGDLYLIPSGSQVLLGDGVPVGPEPAPVKPDPTTVAPEAKGVM
jgi:HK97 family phage portal protein